jgi:hypothetical protein
MDLSISWGFTKEWDLGPDGRFAGKTIIHLSGGASRFVGVLWLITCFLLLASTFAYYYQKEWFWIIGIAGLSMSQILIVLYWPDAKWGTIVNIVLLSIILFAAGRISFDRMVKKEISNLFTSASTAKTIISEERVSTLPNIIQMWLRQSHVVGRPIPASIHIIQRGSMRIEVNDDWMPFDAEQYFTIDPPAFVWKASIHTSKLIDIVGRDKYENGKGNMLIKAASLIPIANSSGKEIDQGTLIRFMAEIIWFPQAAVSDYLHWEEIDNIHARVTMTYKGVTASGIYTFNKDGLPIGFEAQRYGEFNGNFSKETWTVTTNGYGNFEDLFIGNVSEVTWKLTGGDFTWLRLTIMNIEYK